MSKNPTAQCSNNGPYIVKGLEKLIGADTKTLDVPSTIALCRCGASFKKPFCDGTHTKIDFKSERSGNRVKDERKSFEGKNITIHDNRGLCSHAGFCTNELAQVFKFGSGIEPDAADMKEVIRVIKKCPSGALSYSIDQVEYRDQDRPAAIRIEPHGPYNTEGGIVLEGTDSLEGASEEHRSLCRCGHSKNKPFCDGAHWAENFHDDDKYRIAVISELTEGSPIEISVEGIALRVFKENKGTRVVTADESIQLGSEVNPRWGEVLVDLKEIRKLKDTSNTSANAPSKNGKSREEPFNNYIHELAENGLKRVGSHGPMAAMGVPRYELPSWNDIQILTAQLHRLPKLDDFEIDTTLVVGPGARKPLGLKIPIIVSDMSFGALSMESKIALARGAELSGTGICSGEGGMLPDEQKSNHQYFYELASAQFGFSFDQLKKVQAFHFKGGQGAKTGTGGHLPGEKVTKEIAKVRGLKPGQDSISPARFPEWNSTADFCSFAKEVREITEGIPIGFKLSAQNIEKDLDAALEVDVDYIILDGRGGGTGAAPLFFRDNISVPTIPALARARRHLDQTGVKQVTLFITGGLRTPADFVKAMALGADGIAIANSAIQAIGCLGARICNSNNCPAGIATQKAELRALLNIDKASARLHRFLESTIHLMSTMARACGHTRLSEFNLEDLTTWKWDVAYLSGVPYGGVAPIQPGLRPAGSSRSALKKMEKK